MTREIQYLCKTKLLSFKDTIMRFKMKNEKGISYWKIYYACTTQEPLKNVTDERFQELFVKIPTRCQEILNASCIFTKKTRKQMAAKLDSAPSHGIVWEKFVSLERR